MVDIEQMMGELNAINYCSDLMNNYMDSMDSADLSMLGIKKLKKLTIYVNSLLALQLMVLVHHKKNLDEMESELILPDPTFDKLQAKYNDTRYNKVTKLEKWANLLEEYCNVVQQLDLVKQ